MVVKLNIFLEVNKLIITSKPKNNPPTFKPAKYPLLVASLPFLRPKIKNAAILKINIIKLVMVEFTPIKFSKLVINTRSSKNIE